MGEGAVPLGVSSAISFGAAVPLLLIVTAGATCYASLRMRALRLTGSES